MFEYHGFYDWVKRQEIPLTRISGNFVLATSINLKNSMEASSNWIGQIVPISRRTVYRELSGRTIAIRYLRCYHQ